MFTVEPSADSIHPFAGHDPFLHTKRTPVLLAFAQDGDDTDNRRAETHAGAN